MTKPSREAADRKLKKDLERLTDERLDEIKQAWARVGTECGAVSTGGPAEYTFAYQRVHGLVRRYVSQFQRVHRRHRQMAANSAEEPKVGPLNSTCIPPR